jgi:hypothetical protein
LNDSELVYYIFNKKFHGLYFHNIYTGNEKYVDFDFDLKEPIQEIFTNNNDSIYLFGISHNIFQISKTGKLIKKISLPNTNYNYKVSWGMWKHFVGKQIFKNHIYSFTYPDSISNNQIKEFTEFYRKKGVFHAINMINLDLEYSFGSYDEQTIKKYNDIHLNTIFTINNKSEQLVTLNTHINKVKFWNINNGKFQKEIIIDLPDFIQADTPLNHFKIPQIKRLLYDKYRNLYYILTTGNQDKDEPYDMKNEEKYLSQIFKFYVLDDQFKVLKTLNFYPLKQRIPSIRITSKGLMIGLNDPNEFNSDSKNITYEIYKFN